MYPNIIPHCSSCSNTTPIKKGDIKAPRALVKKNLIELACPFNSSETEVIIVKPEGPIPLSKTYMYKIPIDSAKQTRNT